MKCFPVRIFNEQYTQWIERSASIPNICSVGSRATKYFEPLHRILDARPVESHAVFDAGQRRFRADPAVSKVAAEVARVAEVSVGGARRIRPCIADPARVGKPGQ